MTQIAKLFQNGRSQAVRLPKEFRFEGDKVFIVRVGKGVMLVPYQEGWDPFFQALEMFPDDFMAAGRQQPTEQQQREPLDDLTDDQPMAHFA
ncbi:MAG: antitoxin [Caldilineaceae bacterium]|nr:antitoxin [Caldilineaceae bacterium]